MKTNKQKPKTNNGFVLLFTVLVSAILLGIALGLINIVVREARLSSAFRDSQLALAAADAGIECGIYWDLKYTGNSSGTAYATSTNGTGAPQGSDIFCAGADISDPSTGWSTAVGLNDGGWYKDTTGGTYEAANQDFDYTARTAFDMELSNGTCALVTVYKDGDTGTLVEARGFNTCAGSGDRSERGLRVLFGN